MTVISAIKGKDWGGMVGDTQSSTHIRKSNTTEKIDVFRSNGTKILVGGSGTSDILYETISGLRTRLDQGQYTTAQFTDKLSEIATEILRGAIQQRLRSSFDLTEEDIIRGYILRKTDSGVERIDIKPETLAQANQVYLSQHESLDYARNNGFLIVGQDERGVEIYKAYSPFRRIQVRKECDSIGSGSDEADKVLTRFMKDLPREERHSIGFLPGMYALIKATNEAAEINVGVGGTPVITFLDAEGIHIIGENKSILASELVKVAEGGLIAKNIADGTLERILRDPNVDFREVRGKIFGNGKKYRDITEYLAGYK